MENTVLFLTQKDLAKRWNISHQTLERWRWWGKGPQYFKFGNKVRYKLPDIEAYEAGHLLTSTSQVSEI